MGNQHSRNHLPGKDDIGRSRKPLRNNSEKSTVHAITIPICREFSTEGHIDFLTSLPDIQIFEGLFSFTLYYNLPYESFIDSQYYCGLFIYAEIIHNHPYFKSFAMVIYTDKRSLDILQTAFSAYPKVIYAVTNWPAFAKGDDIEGTILRCMRFQAVEAFPSSIICSRDADTVFTTEIMTADQAYRKGFKGKTEDGTVIDDYRPFLAHKIGDWEAEFIKYWKAEGSPINIGTNLKYLMQWHTELPFVYSIKNSSKRYKNTPTYKNARTDISREKGGRFTNYYKTTSNRLVLKAPLGIYAGFMNFLPTRPLDLWSNSFDYITSHYSLVNFETEKIISNTYVEFVDKVGKDERIVLFTMIPKYYKICYFFSLEYYGSSWIYYLPAIYKPTHKYVKITPLLDFGTIDGFRSKFETHPKGTIIIHTILLSPEYVKNIYEAQYHPFDRLEEDKKLDTLNDYDEKDKLREEKKAGKPIVRHPLNYYFQEMFAKFSNEYLVWINELMKIPEANMDEQLGKIIRMQRINEYTNAYRSLNEDDFFVPIKRIKPRKSLVGGFKKKTRYKRNATRKQAK
jgi:hypothetical protein